MKVIALLGLFWCFTASAFTVYPGNVTLPPTVRYRCADDLKDAFLAQFGQWNNALSGRFTLIELPEGQDGQPDIVVQHTDTMLPRLGWFDGSTTISIAKTLPQGENISTIILHELGHRLGLAHSTDSTAIMYPIVYPGEPPVLAEDDVEGIRSLYGLPALELSSLAVTVKGTGFRRVFSTGGYSVDWDFGDGLTGTGQKVRHRYAARGVYTVTATYLGVRQMVDVQIGHPKHH